MDTNVRPMESNPRSNKLFFMLLSDYVKNIVVVYLFVD